MNIFISWSGELSQKLAETLNTWLPTVIQSLKPYFTPSDIEKGTKWESEITKKLNECTIGIICLTPENTNSPWILFEAGALSNKLDKSRVCPLLFDLTNPDLTGPLATFQTTVFGKEEFKKLLNTVNKNLADNKLTESVFDEVFETFYPKLEEKVNAILEIYESKKETGSKKSTARTDRDILEEILELTRRQYIKPKIGEYDISKVFDEMSKKDIEFIREEIAKYMSKKGFKLKEYSLLDKDDLFETLKENIEIRKSAGTPENLRAVIEQFISGK